MIVASTPEDISRFRVITLKSALKLEISGMKKRGPSVYSIIKEEFEFKGSKESVLGQLENWITKTYGVA